MKCPGCGKRFDAYDSKDADFNGYTLVLCSRCRNEWEGLDNNQKYAVAARAKIVYEKLSFKTSLLIVLSWMGSILAASVIETFFIYGGMGGFAAVALYSGAYFLADWLSKCAKDRFRKSAEYSKYNTLQEPENFDFDNDDYEYKTI